MSLLYQKGRIQTPLQAPSRTNSPYLMRAIQTTAQS